jgi:DNA-binding NarL/FixJ family response regulator
MPQRDRATSEGHEGGLERLRPEDITLVPRREKVELPGLEDGDTLLFCGGEALFRAGLHSLVRGLEGLYVLGETETLADAEDAVERLQPAIVVLDVASAARDVTDVLRALRHAAPAARILVLTADDHHAATRRRLLEDGAAIVVGKDDPADVFLHAVAWLRTEGRAAARPAAAERKMGDHAPLSIRERDVVRLVCRGLRNEQIARTLAISEATVRHHLTSIYAKCGVRNRAALIVQTYHAGWSR